MKMKIQTLSNNLNKKFKKINQKEKETIQKQAKTKKFITFKRHRKVNQMPYHKILSQIKKI